jgi:hypothetical protein
MREMAAVKKKSREMVANVVILDICSLVIQHSTSSVSLTRDASKTFQNTDIRRPTLLLDPVSTTH